MTWRSLGRDFGWLWAANAASAYGTWIGFGAFSVVAVSVLHSGPTQVSLLTALGLVVGALVAVPAGPWVERRHKRPVMIGSDLVRFAALASLPVAYVFGGLSFVQLVLVSVMVAAAKVAFDAAAGTLVKTLVSPDDLLTANSRFESTRWSATVVGPALGGGIIALSGPLVTIAVDAGSYVLSALGIRAMRRPEPSARRPMTSLSPRAMTDGWRFILAEPRLRAMFANTVVFNGLIMAGEPLLAVLMLGRLGFAPWQYGVAFSLPCIAGLVGSRVVRRVVTRWDSAIVLRVTGIARVVWPIGLAAVQPGVVGMAVVIIVEFGLILCCSMFGPVYATVRQQCVPTDRLARVLAAWSISTSLCVAALTAFGGVLATLTSPRIALAVAGVAVLFTPLLLPRTSDRAAEGDMDEGRSKRVDTPVGPA